MDSKTLALIAVIIAAALFLGVFKPGYIGGTVLTLNQVGYTNDPSAPFEKPYQVNVVLDGGANYLYGATSQAVKAPGTESTFTVNFKLNSLSCNYPLQATKNTLSSLAIKNYQVPNSNNFLAGNPWSAACRIEAALANSFANRIYAQYAINADPLGNPIYCNAFPTAIARQLCSGDYRNLCDDKPGFVAVPCEIPQSKKDALLQQMFGSNPYSGYSCIKIEDRDPNIADYTFQEVSGRKVKADMDVSVTKLGGQTETIKLNEGNNYQGTASNVYAKSTYTVNSLQNTGCSEYSDIVSVRHQIGANFDDFVNAKSELTTLKSAYDLARNKVSSGANLDQIIVAVAEFDTRMAYAFKQTDWNYKIASGELIYDRSSNPPQLPVILLYVKAAWLGIVNPVAKPALGAVSPNPITFTSGQPATGQFTVTNIATVPGSISVSSPICQPSASFTWNANPNRQYNALETYTASFSPSAAQGQYSCVINAESGGYVTSGNYNPTSTTFTMNVAGQCTNPASPPRYRDPKPDDPCHVSCPLDPAVAGRDVCAESGLRYDANSCSCVSKPDCKTTNTCPDDTKCSDGTNIGICVLGQQVRCSLVGTKPTLVTDITCPGKPSDNETKCLPFIQKVKTEWVGGFLGIGATQVQTCENDLVGIGAVILVALGGIYLWRRKI